MLRKSIKPSVGDSVRVSVPGYRIPAKIFFTWWACKRLARLARWGFRHPGQLLAIASGVYIWARWDIFRWVIPALSVPLLAALVVFGIRRPRRFRHVMLYPLLAAWRRTWIYNRRWDFAVSFAELVKTTGKRRHIPSLGRVRTCGAVDRVTVRMLPDQLVEDWSTQALRMAQTFGAIHGRAVTVPKRPHHVELRFTRRDVLREEVPLQGAISGPEDLFRVPVGRTEDGHVFTLPLLHSHLLIAGETGSGKGSAIWSLLHGLGPGIRDGYVSVAAIDPKGGLELWGGRSMFARFAYGKGEGKDWQRDMCELLEAAASRMRSRAVDLRARKPSEGEDDDARKLWPTPRDPLLVVVVDELSALTAYVLDRTLRQRMAIALSMILSQGRAPGVCLVAATQDVRKETVSFRDLFPNRVALRTAGRPMADLILGAGAAARGALTDRIPDGAPGIGYAIRDDQPEPIRFRFSHVRDADIRRMAAAYSPSRALAA